MRPFIVEIGMGIDLHGQDVTKAAQRAVRNAIEHNSLPGLRQFAGVTDPSQMAVEVTVAVPVPADRVDTAAVLSVLPFGQKSIRVVHGGMKVGSGVVIESLGDISDDIIVVNACVTVGVLD